MVSLSDQFREYGERPDHLEGLSEALFGWPGQDYNFGSGGPGSFGHGLVHPVPPVVGFAGSVLHPGEVGGAEQVQVGSAIGRVRLRGPGRRIPGSARATRRSPARRCRRSRPRGRPGGPGPLRVIAGRRRCGGIRRCPSPGPPGSGGPPSTSARTRAPTPFPDSRPEPEQESSCRSIRRRSPPPGGPDRPGRLESASGSWYRGRRGARRRRWGTGCGPDRPVRGRRPSVRPSRLPRAPR